MTRLGLISLLGATLGVASMASATIVISDSFETDTSANYTVVNDGTPDGTQTFAFDYVAAGIPLAPRSTAGDKGGLRFTSNDTAGVVDATTAFHNTLVNATSYRLTVDVYHRFDALAASTEYANVGVGGNATTFNSVFTPISGSGSFLGFTGDGGSGSDYRWYLDAANGGPTTVPGADPSMLAGSANNTAALYQTLFPSPPATVAGSPGNIWTTLEILVDAGTITYSFDGTPIIRGTYTGNLNGAVSLGHADLFTSVAAASNNIYVVYDNLTVEVIPEPATLSLLAGAGLLGLRRRR